MKFNLEEKGNMAILTILVLLVGMGVYAVAASYQAPADSGNEALKIGVITSMTGKGNELSVDVRKGVELAEEELEERGADVEFIYEDNQMSPKKSVTAYKKLSESNDIDVAVSTFSSMTMPLVPLAEEDKVPLLGSIVSAKKFVNSKYTARFYPSRKEIYRDCSDMYSEEKSQLAMLNSNEGYGNAVRRHMKEYWEGEIVYNEVYSLSTKDFKTQLTKVKESGADLLQISGFTPHMLQILRQREELGVEISICAPTQNFLPLSTRGAVSNYTDRFTFNAFKFDLEKNKDSTFAQKFKEKFGEKANGLNANGYDMAMTIYKVAKDREGDLDPERFMQELKDRKFEGVNGEFQIRESGESTMKLYPAKLQEGKIVPAGK